MSDLMLYGVLRMPYELAMEGEISRLQFCQRAKEAADRLERADAEIAELHAALAATAPTVAVDGLLSCPFCGSKPEESERTDNFTSTGSVHFISCMCGGYSANAHQFGETRDEVVSKWNRRAKLSAGVAIPAGWALVPVEPTDEMAFATTHVNNSLDRTDVLDMLRAAIAAAPSPDKQGEKQP